MKNLPNRGSEKATTAFESVHIHSLFPTKSLLRKPGQFTAGGS